VRRRVGVDSGEDGPEIFRSPVDVNAHGGNVTTDSAVLQYPSC
jgi:hypothetical protein